MQIHIVCRTGKYGRIDFQEIVSVFEKKKDAAEYAKNKNSIHEAHSPYLYRVVTKKIIPEATE
ncbi:hypothetical protein DWQ72_11310 [Salmonella enterica]|nr:hypothetical protein [Salmonella enterica]ECE5792549.1 hypothetical protein [Salmonella enterica subsp. diarizonae]ECU9996680.1 hypothetical protein [Salmonella enterica subsp. diarizonae serovar 48:i:z]EBJ5713679.1 hypothetical protein [Salmonella enterica]EBM2455896.1 hypothetical protein [Salmonella enterica]